MDDRLFGSIGFSGCSLFFVIFVFIMFLNKRRYKDLDNSLFLSLIILSFLLIFSEFAYTYFLSRGYYNDTGALFCRIWLNILIIWMLDFTYYIIVNTTKKIISIEERKNKCKKFGILFLVGGLILLIISNLLPIEFYDLSYHIYSFSGPAAIVGFLMAAITLLITTYAFVIRKDMVNSTQRKSIVFTVSSIGLVTLVQIIYPQIDHNFQNFESTMLLVMLFLTLESQDNKLLAEHEKAKEQAEELNKEQTDYLTSMSHEIRTPMSAIMGLSEVILREKNDNFNIVKNDMDDIHKASVFLLELINNILDLSRIESGKETIVEKNFELVNSIININNIIKNKIDKSRINYNTKVDNNIPSVIYGDVTKIEKIAINLLINTLSYLEKGNLLFEVNYDTENNRLRFIIESNGNITSHDEVKKIFKYNLELTQVNSTILGINLAKKYSDIIKSNIIFSESLNQFKYIFEFIPTIINMKPIGNIESLLNENNNVFDLSSKKILVVDDNELNIKLMIRLLNSYKVNIEYVTSGAECIDKVQNNKYDLIFLDHMMPEMDGIVTLGKLNDLIKDLPPVIALTANNYAGAKEFYKQNGFTDYLDKPLSVNKLHELLVKIFQNK